MKASVLIFVLFASTAIANDVYHQGYTRRDGTYVQPHYQTAPDNSRHNNYSAKGNYNPYTGEKGTVDPYRQPSTNSFDSNNQYNQQRRRGSQW